MEPRGIWGTSEDGYREVTGPLRDLYDHVADIAGDEVAFQTARALAPHEDRVGIHPERRWRQ